MVHPSVTAQYRSPVSQPSVANPVSQARTGPVGPTKRPPLLTVLTALRHRHSNVCVNHERGDASNTVLVVANLDSSTAGPGVNRKGSGAAVALELALGIQTMGLETTNRCARQQTRPE